MFNKPFLNINFDSKDHLKVLFEPRQNNREMNPMILYFKTKKKGEKEMIIPETTENYDLGLTDQKYTCLSWSTTKAMKADYVESLKVSVGKTATLEYNNDNIND